MTLQWDRGKKCWFLLLASAFLLSFTGCEAKPSGAPGAQALQQATTGSSAAVDQKAERARTVDAYFESVVEEVSGIDVVGTLRSSNVHPRRVRQPYPTREQVEQTLGPPEETNTTEGTVTWGDWVATFSKRDRRLAELTHYLSATPIFASGWENIERDAHRWSLNRVGGA